MSMTDLYWHRSADIRIDQVFMSTTLRDSGITLQPKLKIHYFDEISINKNSDF